MSDEETESITVLSARLKATKAAKASKTKQQAQEGGVESKGNQKVSPQRKSAGTKFSFGGYLLDELNDLETELVEVERWRPKQTTGFLASLGPNGLLKKVKELDPLLQNVLNPKLATQKGSITDLLRDAIVQTDITVEELDLILSCDETFFGLKARGQRDYIKNAKMVNLLRRMATEMELEMKLDGRSSFSACYPFLVELGIQSIPSGRNTVQKIEKIVLHSVNIREQVVVLCSLYTSFTVLRAWSYFCIDHDRAVPFGKVNAIMSGGVKVIQKMLRLIFVQIEELIIVCCQIVMAVN